MSESVITRDCLFLADSIKPAQTITLSVTVTGKFTAANGTGDTGQVEYDGTPATHVFTREPFSARAYGGGARPSADGFWLVSDCCCVPCRWSLLFYDAPDWATNGPYDAHTIWGVSVDWTETYSPGNGTNATGSTDSNGTFDHYGFAASPRERYCMSDGETGRENPKASVDFFLPPHHPAGGTGWINPGTVNWDYTDSDGNAQSGSGAAPALYYSMQGTADRVFIAACEDSQSGWRQTVFNGTTTVGGVTFTVDALTVRVEFSIAP